MSASSPLPRPFGPYVLTRALGSDPLGEVWRAGVPSSSGAGIRSFLHIREFSGAAVDRTALLLAMETAVDAVDEIKGPSVARGAVMGAMDDTPFLGVEYVPGRTLDTVFASRGAGAVFPIEHALLIAEKILVAFEAAEPLEKLTGAPHGFLIPAFVYVSNDGETRVFGGGLGTGLLPALRVPRARSTFLPYIAPEVLESGRPTAAGDVYSTAVILFEALTGRLPAGPDPLAAATLAIDGTPLPEDVKKLLRRGLHPDAARRERVVAAFRKELGNLLYGGPYSPSTFNLAFFMQRHFEKAIQQEKKEVAAEEQIDAAGVLAAIPAQAPTPAPAPPPAMLRPDVEASGGRRPMEGSGPRIPPVESSGGRRPPVEASGPRPLESSGPKRATLDTGSVRRPPLETSGIRIPPAPPQRPPERMARTGAMRVLPERPKRPRLGGVPLWAAAAVVLGIGAFFLVEWRQRSTVPVPTPVPVPTALPPTPVPTPEPVVVGKDDPLFQAAVQARVQEEVKKTEKRIAKDQESVARKKKADFDKTADETGKVKDSEDLVRTARERADREEAAKLAREARDARKREEAARAAAAAEEAVPKVKEGDVVDADTLDTPPTMLRTVKPEPTQLALRRRINGTVLLRVLVNETGHAEKVDLLRDTPEKVGLGDACVRALKQWVWTPPVKDKKKVKTWIPVQVPFKLG